MRNAQVFTKLAIPLTLATTPGFTFYPVYKLVPVGTEYDTLIYFSVAMFDMWLSVASVVVVAFVPFVEPKMLLFIRWFPRKQAALSRMKSQIPESDVYFNQLSKALHA
ncbi:hypothetical protein PENTCL1PPCAC_14176, partial [Pristionchus entomophagus]